MPTLHQVAEAAKGDSFMQIERVTVQRQRVPKVAKNDKAFSVIMLKAAGPEMTLMLWEPATMWKLPIGVELTLRGKFIKDDYDGGSLKCEELSQPEGAVEWPAEEIIPADKPAVKASVKDCLEAGIRASEWMHKKNLPQLEAAAFTFAANACLNGVRPE